MKINRISPHSSKYLQIVDNIAKAPEKLYFIGKIPEIRLKSIAIVGTRKPTNYGKEVTYRLSYDLAKHGIVIISGLALGIDAIAAKACLDAGGKTIAVVAGGVDIVYPASNRALYQDIIAKDGAIISEYEPSTHAMKYQFLERNRIVSGLSDGILITEAAIASGTMSTAAHALEQGKDVFVIPGNITSPMSAGCNKLIKQGAIPVTCAEDIIEVIAPELLSSNNQTSLILGTNELEAKIIEIIKSGVRDGDEIQAKIDIDSAEFSSTLTMMELNGQIRSVGANRWTIR